MTTPHPSGARPGTLSERLLPILGWAVLSTTSAAVALVLPARALLALVLLGLLAGAVTRVGLWLVGERTGMAATVLAARAGAGSAATGLGVAGLVLLLGPATPEVLAAAILVTLLYLAATRATGPRGRP